MNSRFWGRGRIRFFFSLLSALLFLAGCSSGGSGTEGPEDFSLKPGFTDDAELESYLKNQFAASLVDISGITVDAVAMPSAMDGAGAAMEGDAQARAHSGTNLQEAGVDESDKVKTDGGHLYVAQQDGVRILRLEADGTPTDLARVALEGPADSLYLHRSLLVVLYRPLDSRDIDWCGMQGIPTMFQDAPSAMPCWIAARAKTAVLLLDVQDPANPLRLAEKVFDGELVSSRRIGSRLHLVSRFMPELPPLEYSYGAGMGSRDQVVLRNRNALQALSLNELLPAMESRDGSGNPLGGGPMLDSRDFLRPSHPRGGSIVTVSTFDLDNPRAELRSVGAVLDARHLYASADSLYLAAQSWESGQARTQIHRFDLSAGQAVYAAGGSVPGTILNRFSLGEHEGVLRVATSTGDWWGVASAANHVYCLKQEAQELQIVGRLENLAPGERLYAARFMGSRGYLVTFVQVDPLFTLDLSDPAAPRVAGELKVPGYSEYLHPLGVDYLLSIGKNAVVEGGVALYQGLQLSIFDLRDFSAPALLFRQDIGDRGTESQALRDHRAFGFWAERGLLAVPVELAEHPAPAASPWEYGLHSFSGLYVYRVDPLSGFDFVGRLGEAAETPAGFAASPWVRGLFVGERVFGVGEAAVYCAALGDMENSRRVLAISP